MVDGKTIATYVTDIAALLFLLGILNTGTILNNRRKRPFTYAIALTIVIILAEAGSILAAGGGSVVRTINIICNILGFALTPLIPLVLLYIVEAPAHRPPKWLLLPTVINVVAVVLSPFYRLVFHIDAQNQYFRGDYFFIFVLVYIINLFYLILGTLHLGKKYNYPISRKIVALSLFTIVGTSVQLVYPWVYSSWHCVTVALFLYFLLLAEFDSSFDTLTGLYNRAAFNKAAKRMVNAKGFSVIVLDINDFKTINDTYGHEYGDVVIKAVAEIIREAFSQCGTCYRVGGDEFYIICNTTDSNKLEDLLKKMTSAIIVRREVDSRLPMVSYGFSIYRGGETPDIRQKFEEADHQMYSFKKRYKDSVAGDDVI